MEVKKTKKVVDASKWKQTMVRGKNGSSITVITNPTGAPILKVDNGYLANGNVQLTPASVLRLHALLTKEIKRK